MMLVIGVTGGLGTGKSTVARMFEELGAVVIDADALAHEALEPKRLAWRAVIRAFGEDVVNDDQTINRGRLGERVFGDPKARRRLEAIVHPQVFRRIKQRLHRLKRNRRLRAVVVDVPLLMETGSESLVDVVVVVTAPPAVQRRRLQGRSLSDAHVTQRLAAQWDLASKAARADYVVENGDGLEQTRRQVRRLWNRLLEARRSKRRG